VSHRLLLGIAIGLTGFFVIVALAFAWSAGVHDAALAGRLNSTIAPASSAPGSEEAAAPPSGIESFEQRCARCHSSSDVTAWTSRQSGNRCEALDEFLQKHRKAPERENRAIALQFAPGCQLPDRG